MNDARFSQVLSRGSGLLRLVVLLDGGGTLAGMLEHALLAMRRTRACHLEGEQTGDRVEDHAGVSRLGRLGDMANIVDFASAP